MTKTTPKKASLTHFSEDGAARMVDVGAKPDSERIARAQSTVVMQPETLALITSGQAKKGDVLAVARLAGIMAAKKTADLIPLCHNLNLSKVTIDFQIDKKNSSIKIQSEVRLSGKTGVEMEALTAVTVTALTIYDMCKAVDRGMEILQTRLLYKSGGKTGVFDADSPKKSKKSKKA